MSGPAKSSDSSAAKGLTTTLAVPTFEERTIVVAQGIDFNNADIDDPPPDNFKVPHGYLKDQIAGLVINADGTATYTNMQQGVRFRIKVTTKKAEFKKYLETPLVHVIYDGHSRFGRGACFGENPARGEDWENGSKPTATGLFRMGFPFVGVPIGDIRKHGYTAEVVSASTRLVSSESEPVLRQYLDEGKMLSLRLADVDPNVHAQLSLAGTKLAADDRFWGFDWPGEGRTVVLRAGWENTVSRPMDLGATTLKCRVFCHFGCSSFQHYREIVRNRKTWKKEGNTNQFAYFCSDLSYTPTSSFWLRHLLTYDQFNADMPWEPSLEYARHKAILDLKDWCLRKKLRKYEIW